MALDGSRIEFDIHFILQFGREISVFYSLKADTSNLLDFCYFKTKIIKEGFGFFIWNEIKLFDLNYLVGTNFPF